MESIHHRVPPTHVVRDALVKAHHSCCKWRIHRLPDAVHALVASTSSSNSRACVHHIPRRRRHRQDVHVMAVAQLEQVIKSTSHKGEHVLVRLSVPFRVAFGQVIKVVGSAREFGEWDVVAAPTFEWTEGDIWMGNFNMDPGVYEYKVVVYTEATRESKWESGANRVLEVPKGPGTLTTSCYWGSPSTQGWFIKGDTDPRIRLTPLSSSGGGASSSKGSVDKPAAMLQKGWNEMFQRSKTPDVKRSSSPDSTSERSSGTGNSNSSQSYAKSSSSTTSSASGGSSGNARQSGPKVWSSALTTERRPSASGVVRLSRWADVDEDGTADDNSKYLQKGTRKSSTSASSSASPVYSWPGRERGGSGTASSTRSGSRSSNSASSGSTVSASSNQKSLKAQPWRKLEEMGRGWTEDMANLGGKGMMRNLSSLLSGRQLETGMQQLREADSRVVLRSVQDALSEGGVVKSGLQQLQRDMTHSKLLHDVRDVLDHWANREERAVDLDKHHQQASSRSRAPSPVLVRGRQALQAVADVFSTKSPSAIRGEAIDIEDLKAAYKTKVPIPLNKLASRRPGQRIPEYEKAAQLREKSRSPSPSRLDTRAESSPSFHPPSFELRGLPFPLSIDLGSLSGTAIVLAVVATLLTSDAHNLRGNLMGRTDAIRAAFLDPLPAKTPSGPTPQPGRSASKSSPQPGRAATGDTKALK